MFYFQCFTAEGDQIYSQPTFRYYSAPQGAQVRYLMHDAADQIRNMEVALRKTKEEDKDICKRVSAIYLFACLFIWANTI